jgi:hypothetical protein
MCRSSRSFLIIAVFCIIACRLPAEPITLTASSAAVSQTFCGPSNVWCAAGISAAGPSFSLRGSSYIYSRTINSGEFAQPVLLVAYPTSFILSGTDFGPFGPDLGFGPMFVGGQFPPGGSSVLYFGSATLNAIPFVLTCPSPETTAGCSTSPAITLRAGEINLSLTPASNPANFVLPATMTGNFSACGTFSISRLNCLAPPLGNVSIDLPGELSVTILASFAGPRLGAIQVSESFAGTPVPEPAALLVTGLGIALILAVGLGRRPASTVLAGVDSHVRG